jgi:hypothetical protein
VKVPSKNLKSVRLLLKNVRILEKICNDDDDDDDDNNNNNQETNALSNKFNV